jgi:hypothetical protein
MADDAAHNPDDNWVFSSDSGPWPVKYHGIPVIALVVASKGDGLVQRELSWAA